MADRATSEADGPPRGGSGRRPQAAAAALLLCAVATASCATVGANCIAPKYEMYPQHVGCLPRSPFCIEAPSTSLAERDSIKTEFNTARAALTAQDMQVLLWDDELANLAQRWAEHCSGVRDEDLGVPGRFATVGQTVVSGLRDWKTAVLTLKNSLEFVYGRAAAMNYSNVVNYAQVMWANANKFGCGYAVCSGLGNFYVCNFAPGYPTKANFSQPYMNGTSCGACPQTCTRRLADQNLCDCLGVTCQNGGVLQLNSCTCTCTYAHYTGPSCDLNCSYSDPPECAAKTASQCPTTGSGGIALQCPKLCKLCPYADPGYRPPSTTTSNQATGAASGSTFQPTGRRAAAVASLGAALLVWHNR